LIFKRLLPIRKAQEAMRAIVAGLLAFAANVNEAVSLGRVHKSHRQHEAMTLGRTRSTMREFSKDEIMATMNVEKAFNTFMTMNHSTLNPESVALIQNKLGTHLRVHDNQGEDANEHGGVMLSRSAAIDRARNMLNDMMDENIMNKELESIRCNEYETKQLKMIASLEVDITYANAEASACKAEQSRSESVITVITEIQLPKYRHNLAEHIKRCNSERGALQAELHIVMADRDVMKTILDMVCSDMTITVYPGAMNMLQKKIQKEQSSIFLEAGQVETEALDEKFSASYLMQCDSCSQTTSWFKHDKIQPLLASLKSKVANEYIEQNLLDAAGAANRRHSAKVQGAEGVFLQESEYDQLTAGARQIPGVEVAGLNSTLGEPDISGGCNEQIMAENTTTYRGCQAETMSGKTCQKWTVQSPHAHVYSPAKYNLSGIGDHNYCRNPDHSDTLWCYTTDSDTEREACEPLLALKVPDGIAKSNCKDLKQCRIMGDCTVLKDSFLTIMAEIVDKFQDLSEQLDTLEDNCQKTQERFETQIAGFVSQNAAEQTCYTEATECLGTSQFDSDQANLNHNELGLDYHSTMETCCKNKNEFAATVCALGLIRKQLYKLAHIVTYLVDCEVSEWTDKECSVTCGGGTQDRSRTILIHPINGTECPPMSMQRSCNVDECPVDCAVGDWSEWSGCTAECSGGVKSRSRDKTQEPENGGDPCPDATETIGCHSQSCNADCVLADWDAWSLCSKACQGGNAQRRKRVIEPERGLGECAGEDDEETRLDFQTCNDFDCAELLPRGRNTLKCTGFLDLIILLDGSGSLRWYGWKQSKKMAKQLVGAMRGGEHNVQVALLLFSGPKSWKALDSCTGFKGGDCTTAEDIASCDEECSIENTYKGSCAARADCCPPVPRTCGMFWIDHFTQDTKALSQKVSAMKWPRRTTLTSYALSEAKAELTSGRPDAQSVVVVITDGKPMSPLKTASASKDVKNEARLIYIPVGRGIKSTIPKLKKWASKPAQDNVMTVDSFSSLTTPKVLNRFISGFCNIVE